MSGLNALTEDMATAAISTGSFSDFNHPPYLTHVSKEFSRMKSGLTNYLKGCKWSPDGTCVLTNSADSSLRLFNAPDLSALPSEPQIWSSALRVQEVDLVYDYCWYPKMSSADVASSCFLTTAKTAPVHLWDAFTGQLRASYIPKNSVDAVVAANSLAVDPDGLLIYAGFCNCVRVFDISRPGEICDVIDVSRKQEKQGGIISCIAFDPSGVDLVAFGSYNRSIGIYSTDGDLMTLMEGHKSGITHLKFSSDGRRLYSGARLDRSIFCWDLRTGKVLHEFCREVDTNQRVYFDLDPSEKFLCSGQANGDLLVWDLTALAAGDVTAKSSTFQFKVHTDMVNGVSWHPQWSLLTTSSGQRHVPSIECEDFETESVLLSSDSVGVSESNLKLWYIG